MTVTRQQQRYSTAAVTRATTADINDGSHRGTSLSSVVYRAGLLDLHIALTATEYLPHETKWQPWAALKASLPYVDYMLFENWEYGSFRVGCYFANVIGN